MDQERNTDAGTPDPIYAGAGNARRQRACLLCLAGPTEDFVGLNVDAFLAAAKDLRRAGFAVINPVEDNIVGAPREATLRKDIAALVTCDGLALLPVWRLSREATLQVIIAEALGMTCKSVDDWLAQGVAAT